MPKHWDFQEIPALVKQLFNQVLERDPDTPGLIAYGSVLSRGEWSVRDAVRSMGLSDEYRDKFITPLTTADAIRKCYKHFLAREADLPGLEAWEIFAVANGFRKVIDSFADCDEYSERFGNDQVPH
jgi:Phycobilisome Linker polypeptide/Domain of unknown function (DUF4214)